MIARTHDLAALTGLVLVVSTLQTIPTVNLSTLFAVLLANQLGGIAPDIDQPTAPFWRNLPIGGVFGKIISKMLGGHRFLTHSLLGMALVGWLLSLFLAFISPILPSIQMSYVWWAFMIGMLSHLVMDSMTKEGVPWLLPIPIKFGFPPVKSLRIVTGEKMEKFVIFPVMIIILGIFVSVHYHQIIDIFHTHIV